MSSAMGIRIDSLLHSLKELQTEKHCLEQKLNERKSHAQATERRLEQSNAKLVQVKEMVDKFTEMQKVAVQKVQHTQQLVDRFHLQTQSQNSQITKLNNLINLEKVELQNIEDFESKMTELAKKLMEARTFYKKENLQSRIDETKQKIQEFEQDMASDSGQVNSIVGSMDKLQLKSDPDSNMDDLISYQTRLVLWKMLEEEESMVSASLQRLLAEQQEICAVLQESTNSQSVA